MSQRSVRVVLSAVVSGLVDGFKQAERAATNLENTIGRNKAAISGFGTGALAAGAVVAAGIGVAVKAYADFDAVMSKVKSTGQDAAQNMEALRTAALKAGADTKYSAVEAAEGMESMLKAGVSAKDVYGGGLTAALNLAASGNMSVAESAEVMATAAKNFNVPGAQMARVADALAAGANKAQGDVSDMAKAMEYVGIPARDAKMSVEQAAGAIAQLAEAGIVGEKGGTALRAVLMGLTAPSGAAQKAMDSLGITLYDTQGNWLGYNNAVQQLQDKLGPLTDAQRDMALGTLFGNESISAARVLMAGGAQDAEKWTKAVSESGYAQKLAAEQMNNLKGDIEQLSGSVETALIKMGKAGDGPLRDVIKSLTTLVNAAADAPPELQATGMAVAGLSAAGLIAAGGLAKAVVMVKEAKDAMAALGLTAKGTTLAMGGIGVALAIAGVALAGWLDAQAKSQARVESFTDAIKGQTEAINESSRSVAVKALQDAGAADAARQLGLDFGLVTDAALGNADAQRQVTAAIDAASAATMEQRRQQAAATGDAQDYSTAMSDAGSAADLLRGAVGGTNAEFTAAVQKAQDYKQGMAGAAGPTSDLAKLTAQHAEELKRQKDAADAAVKAISEHATMMLQASGSAIGMESAIAGAAKALKENGRGLDITTEKGRANQQALDSLASSTITYRDKLMAAGVAQEAVTAATQRGAAMWVQNAVAMGMDEKVAKSIAGELFRVSDAASAAGSKSVTIPTKAPGAQNAYDQIVAAKRAADAANGTVVSIRTVYTQYGSRPVPVATGGYISGPGTGTSDSIPAMLSNGEYVIRAAAVKALGLARLDYLNRLGDVPRFAEGGQVGPRRYFGGGGYAQQSAPPGGGSASSTTTVNLSTVVRERFDPLEASREIAWALR